MVAAAITDDGANDGGAPAPFPAIDDSDGDSVVAVVGAGLACAKHLVVVGVFATDPEFLWLTSSLASANPKFLDVRTANNSLAS